MASPTYADAENQGSADLRDLAQVRAHPVTFLHRNPPGDDHGIDLIAPILRAQPLRRGGVRHRVDLRLAEVLFFYVELILTDARVVLLQRGMHEYLLEPDSLSRSEGEADIQSMLQCYDTMLHNSAAQNLPAAMMLLRQHRDEMQRHGLLKHRMAYAVRKGDLLAGCRILLVHPYLPLRALRESQSK